MAYAMTKQGSLDNVITYEFICDTLTDMNAIENTYRTLGSVAIVLSGESEGLEVYIAGSNRQWNSLGAMGGGSSSAAAGLVIHICSQDEYNANTLVPTVQTPDETTLYLVPASAESGNLYDEYVYVNEAWEKFGSANIDLSNYIQKTDIATQSTAGLVKVLDNGNVTFNENNQLVLTLAGTAVVKTGQSDHPISVTHQHEAAFYGLAKAAGDSTQASSENAVGTYTAGAKSAIQNMLGIGPASTSTLGLVIVGSGLGITTNHELYISGATDAIIKAGTNVNMAVTPGRQHNAVFYGLAKAAGDTTQASSANTVGTYTETAKSAIRTMLGIGSAVSLTETVSGTTPSITGIPNTIYTCGEVSTISITPPANGTIDVIFTSGSTAAVLTVPNTVKFPAWFDETSLDTDTIYEIMITNGVYGSVMTWAAT